MYYIIFFGIISTALASPASERCGTVIINELPFEEEVLKDGLDAPFQLSIDHLSNLLFFMIAGVDSENKIDSGYLNMSNGEISMIKEVQGGTGTAVDNVNHKAYLGSIQGIYVFDIVTKEVKFKPLPKTLVWQMFFKDRLYYTDLVTTSVYVFENGKSEKVKELTLAREVLQVGVDKHDNIWISNIDGLSVYLKDEGKLVPMGDYTVNSFTTDVEGNLMFLTINGLYQIKEDRSIELVWENDSLCGVAIDVNNNIVYSDDHRIVRLNPVERKCPTAPANEDKKKV